MESFRQYIKLSGLGFVEIAIAATSVGLVHVAGFLFINFPNEMLLFFGPEFYVWFFFQFFLALGVSIFFARLTALFIPFLFISLMLFSSLIVAAVFSSEKKKWIRAILTYPKRVKYFDSTYRDVGIVVSFSFSILLFGLFYLGEQAPSFFITSFILFALFIVYFINTNLRSLKRAIRQMRRLQDFRKNVLNMKFSRNLVIGLVLIAVYSAGVFRFQYLAGLDDLIVSAHGRSEKVGIVGFVGARPITVTREAGCTHFFIDFSDATFSSRQCITSAEQGE